MQLCISSIALMLSAATPPPADAPAVRQLQPASQLKQTINDLWKDGEIASDAEYLKLSQQPVDEAPTPRDLRQILIDWPQPRQMRGWAQQLGVSFEHDRLTLSWGSELGCGLEAAAARDRFTKALKERGYRSLTKAELTAWEKEGGQAVTEWGGVYVRKSGGSELLAWFEAADYTGSSTYLSGVRYRWQVRRPYRGTPKLAEALAVLPAWMKAKYLGDKFYGALADQPITSLSAGKGVGIGFAQPITEKLVAVLEQNGFDYYRENSPGRDGTVQKTWNRYSDNTFAQLMTSGDGKKLRFSCQEPQHTGEPRQGKLALHPSLKLPPEKRPVLPFDKLVFADGELQRRAKLFHDLAQKRAQKDWHVQLYKDGRYSAEPRYTAIWGTSEIKSGYAAKARPYQGMSITLQGIQSDGADSLNSLHANGVFVPLSGWGASVAYSATSAQLNRPTLTAIVGPANEREYFRFDNGDRRQVPLTQHYVTAEAKETDQFHYRFYAQTDEMDFASSLRLLSATPEELRDGVIAQLVSLRERAHEQVESGTTTSVYDMTNVRSDNPPREQPVSARPPAVKTKQSFLAEVDKQLDAREKLVCDHFVEIHAAVQRALPIGALRKELTVE